VPTSDWSMPQKTNWDGRRPAVLLLVFAIHAGILLVALQAVTRVQTRNEEPLVFLALPNPVRVAEPAAPGPAAQKKQSPSRDTQLVTIPTPAQPATPDEATAPIDWNAEADLAIKEQAQTAMAAPPRALDKHGAGADINGGLGPDHKPKPEFGWDRSHTHRVESLEGGGIVIALNDRCVLVLFPFPFGGCGIGKIPVRGDLFDHMRDAPQADGISKNTAP
jgi:hypothetical protein